MIGRCVLAFACLVPGIAIAKLSCGNAAAMEARSGALGALIARGESAGAGGYNAYNRGTAGHGGAPIDFASLTVAEVQDLQRRGGVFAVGKYQIIPATLQAAVAALGMETSRRFTPELQEEIFSRYLAGERRKHIKQYITGAHDNLDAAQLELAMEWAAVAKPGTRRTSYYAGIANNAASITSDEVRRALCAARDFYRAHVAINGDAGASYYEAVTGFPSGGVIADGSDYSGRARLTGVTAVPKRRGLRRTITGAVSAIPAAYRHLARSKTTRLARASWARASGAGV